MVFAHRDLFLCGRSCGNTAGSPVIAGMIVHDRIIDHDRTVNIGIVYNSSIYIHHGRVVTERPAFPSPTAKSTASISVAIIDPAIEADM